jgi:hypothetical protein
VLPRAGRDTPLMMAVNRVGVVPKSGSEYSSDWGMVQLETIVTSLVRSLTMARANSPGVLHPLGVPVVT